MSDIENDDDRKDELEIDDLEWDDALAEWEDDADAPAKAQSAPMPQTPDPAPPRPLYRPPSPGDTFARRAPAPRPPLPRPAAPPPRPQALDFPALGDDGDGEEDESTRIAQIPKELIASLVEGEKRGNDLPTKPPPPAPAARPPKPAAPPKPSPPAVELDFDGLLDGMEQETRSYGEPLAPASARAVAPSPDVGGAAEVVAPAVRDEDGDLVSSPSPKPDSGLFPAKARAAGAAEASPDAGEEPAKAELASTGGAPAPRARGAAALPPPPRPRVPPPAVAAPRPPLPSVPRPHVPKPGGAAPAVPRPPVPSVPRPGAVVPKPAVPPKVPPPPGVRAPGPPRVEAPSGASEDAADRLRATPMPSAKPAARPAESDARAPSEPPSSDTISLDDVSDSVLLSSVAPESLAARPAPLAKRERQSSDEVAAELGLGDPLAADAELDALLGLDAAGEDATEPERDATAAAEEENAREAELSGLAALDAQLEAQREAKRAERDEDDGEKAIALGAREDGADVDRAARERDEAERDALEAPGTDERDALEARGEDDELEAREDEEDELVVQAEQDEDDEDWEALEAEEAAQAEADRGALAARRSVRSRKPRDEVFPMIGSGAEALRLRRRLLTTLAAGRNGGVKARLLVSAAELCEQLGEADEARDLYRQALEADPADVVAIRALRRDATARGAWDELAELFAKEAELALSPMERALALTGLAEVHLGRRNDPAAAEEAAARAVQLEPRSVGARLLLAEARFAQGRTADALEALAPLAESWQDAAGRAAIHVEIGRHAEREGHLDRARACYRAAAELDGRALDALLGVARTEGRAGGDVGAAVDALTRVAEQSSGSLREALLTRASRVATIVGGDAATGMRLLSDVTGVLPLQARVDAAAASGDRANEIAALSAWASAAGGTDRALALVRMAEALAATGDLDGAEAALRDAALADGSLGTIRLVREVIARRAGDMSRLVEAVAGGALGASARLGAAGGDLERERELLEAAAAEGHALVAVDVLTLDVAAARHDDDTLDAALRRQADRSPPEHRVGSLLALAERAVDRGDLDAAEAILTEARALSPGDPLVLRPLGRLALRRDPTAAAALWLEEAAVASGDRAAYTATEAARVLARANGDAVGALRRALDARPGYGPAAWLLKPLATELGDPLTLGEVHDQLAATASDPTDVAGHLVRGALLRAESDPEGASALLARAREVAPKDAVLEGLLLRANASAPLARAEMLAESADGAPPLLSRVYRLGAAADFEDAGEHARAAALYRAVAAESPEDAVVRLGLDRAEIAAGEIARVAERRFAAVKEAESDERRVLALERLADLDLHERKDPASAVLSLMSILETAPGHLPSLRALQRYFAEQKRHEDAVPILVRMAEHLEPGPDVTAHLRLARRLMLANPEATGDVADELLVSTASRAELDLWLAPRVLAAARARGDDAAALAAAQKLAELLGSADERASARVRAAEIARKRRDTRTALALLREAVATAPHHPRAAEELARTCELEELWKEAAEAWEAAARSSEVRAHAAALFYRAGRIWQERLDDAERARQAFEQASERDVTHADVFDRLRELLEAAGDRERLAELFGQRLSAGGETSELVELYVKQAKLYSDLRELEHAKSALRSALVLMPERLDALRSLANLCLEDEDWRGAAEVLIRIARIRKEREELRWVFFTLGDIYDRHLPDPRRAEAAFQRVLKLLPQDVEAMERLAALYDREGQPQKAAEMLAELARLDVDPERNRMHRLKLAETFERLGDARRAEQVLEEARKNAPTDLQVLRALAELYQRQNAANAMAMHLNRAVNDFRHALEADLGDAPAWLGLVEVLTWRGDADAASTSASAAQALGIVDVEMSKLVDARGAAPALGGAAVAELLDEIIAPVDLPAPTRAVFKLAGDALEKSLPFDLNAYHAEKLNPRDTAIRPLALEVARWFGIPDPQLYVTSAAPRVCVPVYSNPATLLVGSELLGITDDREKLFVLVRAFKIAHAQLAVVVRAQPHEVVALVGGLVQSYDPRHEPAGADPAHVAEAARRIAKNVSKKAQSELGPLVFEMAGRPGYDPSRFAMAASEWGNRVGLIASGSAPAAFSALAKLSGERELPPDSSSRLAMLARFPEARSLLTFAISDACFEARRRAAGRR